MGEKIRPLGEWVVIQPEKPEEKTSSGLIHLPKNQKNRKRRGTVLAVGPGRMLECGSRDAPQVRVGDRVTFLEHNIAQGVLWVDDEHGPCLIPGSEINGVIEPEAVPTALGVLGANVHANERLNERFHEAAQQAQIGIERGAYGRGR